MSLTWEEFGKILEKGRKICADLCKLCRRFLRSKTTNHVIMRPQEKSSCSAAYNGSLAVAGAVYGAPPTDFVADWSEAECRLAASIEIQRPFFTAFCLTFLASASIFGPSDPLTFFSLSAAPWRLENALHSTTPERYSSTQGRSLTSPTTIAVDDGRTDGRTDGQATKLVMTTRRASRRLGNNSRG